MISSRSTTFALSTMLVSLLLLSSCSSETTQSPSKTEDSNSTAKTTADQAIPSPAVNATANKETAKPAASKTTASSQPAEALGDLAKRLKSDKERTDKAAAANEPDLEKVRVEVDKDVRKLFALLAAGDGEAAKAGFLNDDDINANFKTANIVLGRSSANFEQFSRFRAQVGDATPALIKIVHDNPMNTSKVPQMFLKDTLYINKATIEYQIGGQQRFLELRQLLRTDRGWKCLSIHQK